MSMAKVLGVCTGSGAAPWHVIHGTDQPFSVSIGRGKESDVQLPDTLPEHQVRTVSRVHARVFRNAGGLWIEDLGSHNFTFVDGQVVLAPRPLLLPCSLRLGAVTLRLKEMDAAAARAAPARPARGVHGHTTSAVGHSDPAYARELRGNLRWAAAVLDVVALVERARRASEGWVELRTMLAAHLDAPALELQVCGCGEDELRAALEGWGAGAAEAKRMARAAADSPAIVSAPIPGGAAALHLWIVPLPSLRNPAAVLLRVARQAGAEPACMAGEQDAIVSVAARIAGAHFCALGEVEHHRVAMAEMAPHAPGAQMLEACEQAEFWGNSPQLIRSLYQAEVAATRYFGAPAGPCRTPAVFFLGESGTGKSALARVVHRMSNHASGPFVELNCAALPITLVESELFGYERGAHDKAFAARAGHFETADGGTLFLDEVGKTGLDFQSKLLKVLDNGEYYRLGGQTRRKANCYVILANSADPRRLCDEGRMLPELWYRTGAFAITLPPLRERPGDVALLAQRKLDALNALHTGQPAKRFAPGLLPLLQAHPWPGNVREMMYALGVAYAIAPPGETLLALEHFPEGFLDGFGVHHPGRAAPAEALDVALPLDDQLARLERAYLAALLHACAGNLSDVARRSGKSYQTVYNKLDAIRRWADAAADEASRRECERLQALAGPYWEIVRRRGVAGQ